MTVQTSLQRIANKTKSLKAYRFRNLYGMLNEEMLIDSWRFIRKDAAYGVDKVSAQEYEQNLEGNVHNLVERLKRKSYRAKLVRRRYIPKDSSKLRPLGIPATEDKLLQLAVKRILEAIYEQDFLRCSYGYRPNLGALDAVDKLTIKLQFGRYNYVVEADIKSFFDHVDHDWLIRMLEERIDDGALLWLIKKWLKAGVLDTDDKVIHPVTGTPQGGGISPILANLYLHYALDLWFQHRFKRQCRGEACLIRYADDFVCAFEHQQEAERFFQALGARLANFGLQLSPEKTRVIPFIPLHPAKTSFDFLGFEFRWGRDRKGNPHLKRRTSRKKLQASLKRFTQWSRDHRNLRLKELLPLLNIKLRGYYNYFGVHGNFASLAQFFHQVTRILFKWLNRRSQKHSFTWATYIVILTHYQIVKPYIIGRPKTRPANLMA